MFKNRIVNIVIAIIASVCIWFFVTTSVNPRVSRVINGVPIKLLHEKELNGRNLIIDNITELVCDITIEGKKEDVNKVGLNEISALIDVYGVQKGTTSLVPSITIPKNIDVTGVDPPEIQISVKKAITKHIKITPVLVNKLPKTLTYSYKSISPRKISVVGSQAMVNSIDRLVVSIEENNYKEGEKTYYLNVVALDKNNKQVRDVKILQNKIKIVLEIKKK